MVERRSGRQRRGVTLSSRTIAGRGVIDSLETRLLFAGAVSAETRDGVLTLLGDDSANQIQITRDNNDRSTYRVTPLDSTTINGSAQPVVSSDAANGLSIMLGGGDDQVDLLGTYVRGSLIIDAGAGEDRLLLRSVRVTGNFTYNGADEADSLVIRNSVIQR